MKARSLILLGVAAVLGFAAVTWVKKPAATPNMTSMVVAKAALDYGDQLTAAKVTTVEVPFSALPQGAFKSVDEIVADNRVVLRSMVAGEPVLPNKISGKNGRAILSTVIDPSMRAAAIRVDDVNGVAGFVQPGDRVDVMLTRKAADRDVATGTDLLLQNVKVLGVDQKSSEQKDTPQVAKAVTLEVTPEDAQKLTLASNIGKLSLSLRNYADPAAVNVKPLSIADLVPTPPAKVGDKPAEPAPEKPKLPKVEMLRGTDSTVVDVQKDGSSASPPPLPPSHKQTGKMRRAEVTQDRG
jgi:pilus assembly protein CpaB